MSILSLENIQALKSATTDALKLPYPLDAQVVFSAAVLTTKGNIYSGAQYFSDTYSLTLHAEQVALAHAAAHGEGDSVAMAVTSSEQPVPSSKLQETNQLTYCCHMCKQLLWENHLRSGKEIEMIFFNSQGKEEMVKISEMINFPWPPAFSPPKGEKLKR